jgi:glycosyltransferase involved in cell wall biosynthesis
LKIAIVGQNINPPWVEGVRNLAYGLAGKLAESGNEVHIITKDGAGYQETATDRITFHRVGNPISITGPKVLKEIEQEVDLIHFQHFHVHKSFLLWSFLDRYDVKKVGYVCVPPYILWRRWVTQLVKRPGEAFTKMQCISHPRLIEWMGHVDKTVATSNYIGHMLNSAKKSHEVIYPFIDVAKFAEAKARRDATRRRIGVKDKDPLLMYVGNHRWIRGEDQFLIALAKVRRRFPNAGAILVTPLPLTGYISRLIEQLSLNGSLFLVSRDTPTDIPALYAAADAYVFSGVSAEAGFAASVDPPLSVIESLSAGTPAVSYAVGEMGYLASHISGITVAPVGNNDYLTNSIVKTLEDGSYVPDLDILKRNFDASVQARRFLEIYRQTLGN